MSTPRKIIQIAVIPATAESYETLFALADDGTIWSCYPGACGKVWTLLELDSLPEREG